MTFESEVAYIATNLLRLFLLNTVDIIQVDVIVSCGFNVYESDRCLLKYCYSRSAELYA
jgi:hypothetical protein